MKEKTFDRLLIILAIIFIVVVIGYFGFKLGE